ncbi:MAG: serine/threonine protein kinase [Myxococcaceae bacterium]|nr:serine/threonine protein kinase [Myxococcaceae bacterium]
MGKRESLPEVDPRCLPVGTRVGPWRVVGFGGLGAYGTLYRVVPEGHPHADPFALKLAVHPGDKRFEHEAWLLSHIHSPYVPQLHDQGSWEHTSGTYPYLVMDWIDGEPLYQWAARRNPSQRQVLELVAQVARALVATHAAGGLHRDVKGSNVLVRRTDGQAFLTDFGAGDYRGAATLTSKLLPPGTPAYRSPEAWAFLNAFRRHPTVHYPASTCDDLFALGVMAYRLVTDEHPPPTHPEEPGSQVWREGGSGPRPPSTLNPRIGPELDALILRLLAVAPAERFQGVAQEAAAAAEQAREAVSPETDSLLFCWGYEHRPCWRSPEAVRLSAEREAAAREELKRREARGRARVARASEPVQRSSFTRAWSVGGAVAVLALLLVLLVAGVPQHGHEVLGSVAAEGASVAVADSPLRASSGARTLRSWAARASAVAQPLPEEPLPDQRRPPCDKNGQTEIRGGCWYRAGTAKPPCAEDAYAWQGACYVPVSASRRKQPTAAPPQ